MIRKKKDRDTVNKGAPRALIRGNYAKPFAGFKTRVLTKIAVLKTIQDINRFLLNNSLCILKNVHKNVCSSGFG
jgi:hypothetical protein